MARPRILAFAGSTRRDSVNRKLLAQAVEMVDRDVVDVTHVELSDYPMPLYNQDDEDAQGIPEPAKRLKTLFVEHDGLLLACPEYNSSITPLLKNTIDWVSRQEGDEPDLAAYRNKTAALLSASPGRLGGMRGLVHVRAILGNIGVLVIPDQASVGGAYDAFDDGRLSRDGDRDRVERVVRALTETLVKLKG